MFEPSESTFLVSKIRVLIVDNSAISINLHREYMIELGCKVQTLKNPTEAIEKAEAFLPDLILLDQEMDKLKGLDILGLLKKHPLLKESNVVMVTGTDYPDFYTKAKELGACMIIEKPIGKNKFVEKIKTLLVEYMH